MRISDWSSDVCPSDLSGPVRPPRRSERHPSLARVDTINGRSADEVAEGTRFDDLPAAFPTERLAAQTDDETVSIVTALAPIGSSEERRVGKECVSKCKSRCGT